MAYSPLQRKGNVHDLASVDPRSTAMKVTFVVLGSAWLAVVLAFVRGVGSRIVLEILPFMAWAAAITSASLLVMLGVLGELRRGSLAILIGWFVLAVYCQFFGGSVVAGAVGLALQTILAVGLVVRLRLR